VSELAANTLLLYPGGYPLHIDLPQAEVAGLATAMRFILPPHGHNFPLTHAHEHKLVIALRGALRIRRGAHTLAQLAQGEAIVLAPGTVHRICQHGNADSTVGIVLWPGRVEQAFRRLAQATAAHGFERGQVIALLAQYGVAWEAGNGAHEAPAEKAATSADDALRLLPPNVQAILRERLPSWFTAG
jgi:quercetin dioxygenase-like cupin family protein